MMEFGNKAAIALLALSLLSVLFLPGCTSNRYVPCCVRSSIYQENGSAFADPICVFQNGTQYSAEPCKLPPDTASVAFCSNGTTCADLTNEEECIATWDCSWNSSLTPKCQGGMAYAALPVCTDLVPSSCTNNKCTAMVCGYTDIRPSPPPASQDWDAEKASNTFVNSPDALPSNLPANDLQLPAIGLQEVTCSFDTMNNKLYNKVKASRGSLWVNSFRFGVGSSFSDFEAAKNYFPATDRACAVNQYAQVDRFTVYLGDYSFCQPSTTYYECSGPKFAGMLFKTNTSCALYCGGGAPPYACNKITGGEAKYMCNQDGFAYDTQAACEFKCSRIDDPNACANDISTFPFLATDTTGKASYRMKYVSDYVVDARAPGEYNSNTCTEVAGPESQYSFYKWVENTLAEPEHCNDYAGKPSEDWYDGPWFSTYDCYATGCDYSPSCTGPQCCSATCPGGNLLGEQRTYFDNHAYSALDFDYDFYKKALFDQYSSYDQSQRLPFECESSVDCLSGACDTTHYNRPMCSDLNGNALACMCSAKEFGSSHLSYPSCSLIDGTGGSLTMYADTNIEAEGSYYNIASDVISNGPMFYPPDSHHQAGAATLRFKYYALAPDAASPTPQLFDLCSVPPQGGARVQKCIMYDKYVVEICPQGEGDCTYDIYTTDEKVIWDPVGGKCHYSGENQDGWNNYIPESNLKLPSYYWEYDFNLASNNPAFTVNMEKFGICALNGNVSESKDPVPPYLEMKNLGWCAGCSYATLAVQKVDWNASTNPGGYGTPRPYSCYEYRAEFNYVPSPTKALYGGDVEQYLAPNYYYSQPIYEGQVRYGTSSTEPVRYDSNPSAYQFDRNGNIAISWGSEGLTPSYVCEDKWHASGGWWKNEELTTPSAPYLKEKLTSYLQSSIMPILDEIGEKTMTAQYSCSLEGPAQYSCLLNNQAYLTPALCAAACKGTSKINSGYNPLFICNTAGGDGGVLHVIGDTSMLSSGTHAGVSDYGSIYPPDITSDLLSYMDISGAAAVSFPPNSTGGKNAIIARAEFLKSKCNTPPLVGLEILPGENETTLIGNATSPGKLHTFFFKPSQAGYDQRVARGLPDKYPKKVDIFMQDWYPLCTVGSSLYPGEREVYEFEKRMDFSRALLANFSKPSLIWKFAFPKNSLCDQTFFLDYLFNSTQIMVDSGITGIIYSDWSMKDGLGYGPSSEYYSDTGTYTTSWPESPAVTHSLPNLELKTGLTVLPPTVRGTETDQTYVLDDRYGGTGKTSLFCALEKYSLRSIGYISLTYGQKLYAENQTCFCTPCNSYDDMMGVCNTGGDNNGDIPQLYCNDGAKCIMPDEALAEPIIPYNMYKCEPRCMNYTACKLCTSPLNEDYASFCRFTEPGGLTSGYSRDYFNITDDYWEFLTGLPPSEKCCLANTNEGMAGTKYTYVSLTGSKQQSVFLQYPTRGELDIDCGRAPDTSVLEYCNIKVPLSQKEIACMRIDKPAVPIQIVPEDSESD